MSVIRNVRFGDIDSYKDLGLILSSREISSPKIKEHYVDVDGADGSLDLTEALGEIRYETRSIKLGFTVVDDRAKFWDIFSKVQNLIHGKRFRIVFDDDEDFYYVGRVSIDKWKTDKVLGTMNFTIEAEPYKYWREETVIIEDIVDTKTIRLINMRKSVNPTFLATNSMSLVFGSATVVVPPNEEIYSPDIRLTEGEHWLKVNGTGTLTIRYQMASL